jgi:hypothetical protein
LPDRDILDDLVLSYNTFQGKSVGEFQNHSQKYAGKTYPDIEQPAELSLVNFIPLKIKLQGNLEEIQLRYKLHLPYLLHQLGHPVAETPLTGSLDHRVIL